MEFLNTIIDSTNIPLLSAFFLGVLTSISPCPLATNITAVAFISKNLASARKTFLSGLFYTAGRGITYFLLALLIYFGLSSFDIARIFQGWGEKILGPVLIILGLIMLGIIKINFKDGSDKLEKLKKTLASKGYLGSLLLGVIFALAFCPYSGVLFFGVLIPLILESTSGLLLSPIFALGTGLPVIIFSLIIAYSLKTVSQAFKVVQKVEKVLRYLVASVFILSGLYYLKYLLGYLFS